VKTKITSPLDITYCSNIRCPFGKCEVHPKALKQIQKSHPGSMVIVADFSGTCRDYIGWLIEGEERNA